MFAIPHAHDAAFCALDAAFRHADRDARRDAGPDAPATAVAQPGAPLWRLVLQAWRRVTGRAAAR